MKAMLRITSYGLIGGAMALACGGSDKSSSSGTGGDGGVGSGSANGASSGVSSGSANGAGSGSDASASSNGSGSGAGNGATTAGNGASNGAANGTGGTMTCGTSTCTGRSQFGQMLAACCMPDDTCGVEVFGGNCVSADQFDNIAANFADGGFSFPDGGFSFGDGGFNFQNEEIVSDPACADIQIDQMGTSVTLPGCCDSTGICGGSTEGFPAPMGLPIQIPVMCVTPADIGGGQGGGGFDAGPTVPCDYPSDTGNGDAGSTADGG